jgi:nitrogen fixation/metabolism regulation signal transduction histidine kinase
MRLRTKIFRQMVLFAVIPALIIVSVAYYFLFQALSQSRVWLEVSAPDRTINSLRLIETRLQQAAWNRLLSFESRGLPAADSTLDWLVVTDRGNTAVVELAADLPYAVDSVLRAGFPRAELIRRVVGDYLILGAAVGDSARIVAGGYLFGGEYLRGFQAAGAGLSESRRFHNLLPGFTLFLFLAGAAVLALIIIAAGFLSRRLSASVTTPLERLTAVTESVARGQNPEPISVGGTEEITRLAETFNLMIRDLDESRRRLIAAERVAAWQEFASRMAHELKNPLTPISLSLYRIKKSLTESGLFEQYADSLDAISAQVARLERLATEYSSLARLPAPTFRRFDFVRLARDLVSLYAPRLEEFAFETDLPAELITVDGDPDHLHQVMVNLLKNATEFTIPGRKIILSVTSDARMLFFRIVNEGANVDDDAIKSAKLPYFSTREGGVGLGLAISEKIIIDHGGSLTLEREAAMTVARFEIPLVQKNSGGD